MEEWPGRPEEFHLQSPTDPYVNLSIHTARATGGRLPPSVETIRLLLFPVGLISTW
jgi:hypothetical protein